MTSTPGTAVPIDEIERLGVVVQAGSLNRVDAAHQLQQVFEGGLTLAGALGTIDNWETAREEYLSIFDDVLRGM